MFQAEFDKIIHEQVDRSLNVLIAKGDEYATEDRLHSFKAAAVLQQETPIQALAGMLAKHTVSIYDMCKSDKEFSIDKWNEKITDHVNYLLLLRALIEDK